MKIVLSKLETLKKTTSKNEKIELLRVYLKNPLFKKVVQYALDELAHYNIKVMPAIQNPMTNEDILKIAPSKEEAFFKCLDELKSKLGASRQTKQEFADVCGTEDWWEIAQRIVKKDLKCGVQARIVNKACSGLIHIIPYQRCSGMTKLSNITYPAYLQRKADSAFGYFVNENGHSYWLSRKGREFRFPTNAFTEAVLAELEAGINDHVLCGELQVTDEYGVILDRKTGNGILNKALKGTMTVEEESRIIFDTWDCIPVEYFWNLDKVCPLTYEERRNHLLINLKVNSDTIQFIEEETVYNAEEARIIADKLIARGEEGGILKDKCGLWKNNTSVYMVKFKVEKDCDLIITDVLYGDPRTKYENCIGRVLCESSEGQIKVPIGTGLSDNERGIIRYDDGIFELLSKEKMNELMESYKGKIVAIRFNDITFDKKTKQETLYLPRILEIRDDKTEADSYEYIKKLINKN